MIARYTFIIDVTILTVTTTQTILHREWLSCIKRAGISRQTSIEIVTMHTFAPAVTELFFHLSPRKVEPRFIEKRAELICSGHPHHHRRGIGHPAETRLTFSQRVLGPPAFDQIGEQRRDQRGFNNEYRYPGNDPSAVFLPGGR